MLVAGQLWSYGVYAVFENKEAETWSGKKTFCKTSKQKILKEFLDYNKNIHKFSIDYFCAS